jgi:hypothetical protein
MARTSTVNLSVQISGDGQTNNWAPRTAIQNTNAPSGGTFPQALSSGATTITVPTSARGFVYEPPAGSTVAKTLKGVSGDTGVPMTRAQSFVYLFDETVAPPATIVINAASAETGDMMWL